MDVILAAIPTFFASMVEFVEAFTVVLAVGLTRGWRESLTGAVSALLTLGALIAVFGASLANRVDRHVFKFVVGALLLLFGLRWLRKAILRSAGLVALHDEDAVFRHELEALGSEPAAHRRRFDRVGFAASYKATFIEGLEVAFIVITVGTQTRSFAAPVIGAVAAFVAVAAVGAAVHRPLARVPENALKFSVGVMLTAFGVFWGAEGLRVHWPGDLVSLIVLGVVIAVVARFAVAAVRPQPASADEYVGEAVT